MDQIDEVREWFFANPSTSLKDAADHFGLPYEKVRDWGKHNQWHTRRTLKRFEDIPTFPITGQRDILTSNSWS